MISPLVLAFSDSNILQRYISRDTGGARRRAVLARRGREAHVPNGNGKIVIGVQGKKFRRATP